MSSMVRNVDSHDISVLGLRMRHITFFASPPVTVLHDLLIAAGGGAGRVLKCVLRLAHHHNGSFGFEEERLCIEVGCGVLNLIKGHPG